VRIVATALGSLTATELTAQSAWQTGELTGVEVGRLVHRALEAGVLRGSADEDSAALDRLLRDDERAVVDDAAGLIQRATTMLASLRRRPDLTELFTDSSTTIAWRRHEVPFSLRREDGSIIRGAIDCVLKRTNGAIEVLEVKTGRPMAAHERQLEIYVAAARALFPDAAVDGRLIYVD